MSPRGKELNEEMRAQSYAALVEAGRKLFAERGYFNCKVSDIAQKAGMSQGNLYWYFSSKEEILKAVLADGFEKLGAAMAEAAEAPGSGREKFEGLLERLFAFSDERADFAQVMLSLMGHGGDQYFTELGFDMSQIGFGYTQSVAAILAQAQAEGTLPTNQDPIVPTMLFFGLFNGLNLTYGREWLQLPVATVKQAAQRLVGFQTEQLVQENQSNE
jgi:AcrR family transcriptional regulator